MTSSERHLEDQLKEAGNDLLNLPSSIDDLLTLLDVMPFFPLYIVFCVLAFLGSFFFFFLLLKEFFGNVGLIVSLYGFLSSYGINLLVLGNGFSFPNWFV
jgi:hypothetical protein